MHLAQTRTTPYEGCALLRIDEDPCDRGEKTAYYHHPEHGTCYVWLRWLSTPDRAALGIPHWVRTGEGTVACSECRTDLAPSPGPASLACPACGMEGPNPLEGL